MLQNWIVKDMYVNFAYSIIDFAPVLWGLKSILI